MEIFSYQRSFPDRMFPLEREDTTHRNRHARQGHGDRRITGRLVYTHRTGDRERVIRETFRYVDG